MSSRTVRRVRRAPGHRRRRRGDRRLLHDFNTEYDDPTPGPDKLAARIEQLIAGGDTAVMLAGDGPDGLAVLRFRPAIWSEALECYSRSCTSRRPHAGEGSGGR